MPHYTGQQMQLWFGGQEIVGLREVNIPEDHPTHDTTHAPDTHGTAIGGGITYRFDGTLTVVDDTDLTAWSTLHPGAVGELVFYPLGVAYPLARLKGTAIVKRRERPVSYNGVVVLTVTLDISGAWGSGCVSGLLDDFERADGALGSDWGADVFGFGYPAPVIVSGEASHTGTGPIGQTESAYWLQVPDSPDCQVWCAKRGTHVEIGYLLLARLQSPGESPTGYMLAVNWPGAPGTMRLYRLDAEGPTLLATEDHVIPVGDVMGLEIVGETLTGYHIPDGGVRADVVTAEDDTYAEAGYLGFEIGTRTDETGAIDDFSGGPFCD